MESGWYTSILERGCQAFLLLLISGVPTEVLVAGNWELNLWWQLNYAVTSENRSH